MPNNPITEAVNNSSDFLGQVTTAQTSDNTTATSDSPKSTRVRTIQVSEETADAIELYLEISRLYNVSYNYADRRVNRLVHFANGKATEQERENEVDKHLERFYPHITKMIEEVEKYLASSIIDRLITYEGNSKTDTITI